MRRLLLLAAGGVTLLLAAEGAWASARRAAWVAGAPGSAATVDAAAGAVLAPVAWLLVAWLGGVAALAALAAGPGRGSGPARGLLARVAPAAVRRAAAALAGVGLAAGAWAGPASADLSPSPAPSPLGTTFDWGQPAPTAPPLGSAGPAVPAAAGEPGSPASGAAGVTVRPGDSLWRIAARSLSPAGAAPSDAAIAAAWPQWYAANRALIGADPGLIHPGQRLTPPGAAPAPRPATSPSAPSPAPSPTPPSRQEPR